VLLSVSLILLRVPRKARERRGRGSTKWAPLFVTLLNGKDGRWSTSKAGAVLWTYAVWFAFIAILLHTHGKGLEDVVLKQQYLLLLGLPVGAAVVAKGITQSKVESGMVATKLPDGVETNALAGVGQLVADDSGQADLLDFQYFGFNLILLSYFFIKFLGGEAGGLPELPDTLVALSGVSAAGYLGKKGLDKDVRPVITAIDPSPAHPGDRIDIRGANLATIDQTDISVYVNNVLTPAPTVTASADDPFARIETAVPDDVPPGPIPVHVVNYRGVKSDPYSLTIEPAPSGENA
jgi:hypothetical protein